MSLWTDMRLLDTELVVVIDSLLAIGIVASYSPQFYSATLGLSTGYYFLCQSLISTSQLAYALFMIAYGYPSESRPLLKQVANGEIGGNEALGGAFGVIQIAVQWVCSTTLLTYSYNGLWMLITFDLHAAISLLPGVWIVLPRPSERSMGPGFIIGLVLIAVHWSTPVLLALQFAALVWEVQRMSPFFLFQQAIVFGLVAWRWDLCLGRLANPNHHYVSFSTWYQWAFFGSVMLLKQW